MAVGLTAIALSPPAWVAIIAAGLIGFGFSFPWPSVATVVLRRVPPTARASSIGILSATVDLFVALSSFVSGAVATRFGYPSTYVVAMGALGGAVLVGRRYLADESERYSRDAEAVAGHAAASGARPESGLAPTSRSVA
jgi:MFS family permease